jgi:tRNA1(Val) A37 N6-methylase TrmN6
MRVSESTDVRRALDAVDPEETLDSIGGDEVQVVQRREGYRFSVDAMLLADFAGRPKGRLVDLGTGCGIIPLLLAARSSSPELIGVELQEALYRIALRNVTLNGFDHRVRIVQSDFRHLKGLFPSDGFDLVLSNPPYVAVGAGNVNPTLERAVARHELTCTPPQLAAAARFLLRDGGSFKLIFPSQRLVDLLAALTGEGLEPKRMRLVHPVEFRPAKLVLVEAIKGGGADLETLPPLVLHEPSGTYTAEALEILGGGQQALDAGV